MNISRYNLDTKFPAVSLKNLRSQTHKKSSENIDLKFNSLYDEYTIQKRKKFICSICKTVLSTKETLRRHVLCKHIKLKPHICEICNKSFIFERDLHIHKTTHSDVLQYKCICNLYFKTNSSYKYHLKQFHSSASLLKCSICSRSCIDKKQLRYHLQAEHFPKTIQCTFPLCKRIFSTQSLLKNHIKIHSKTRYECSMCNKRFKLKSYMEIHQASHEGCRPYKCTDCDKVYLSISHVKEHWKRKHSEVENFLCSVCGKTFKSNYDVVTHEKSHQEKALSCSICDYKTSLKSSLQRHNKIRHLNCSAPKINGNLMSLRSESERSKKNIPHYIRIATEDTPFKCLDCQKCFKTTIRVNEHWRRYHLVRTDYKCLLCQKLFQCKEALRVHSNSHQEDNLKCNICSYETRFRIALHSHKKMHSKVMNRSESNEYSDKNSKLVENETFSNLLEDQSEVPRKITLAENSHQNAQGSAKRQKKLDKNAVQEDLANVDEQNESQTFESYSQQTRDTGNFNRDKNINIDSTKPRAKGKKEKRSILKSPKPNSDDLNLWDVQEVNRLSEGSIFEQPLFSYLDPILSTNRISGWNNGNDEISSQHLPSKSDGVMKKSCRKSVEKRRNPKITLNCTAAKDAFEESDFYFEL